MPPLEQWPARPMVPFLDEPPAAFVSSRAGNYQRPPGYIDLPGQMCVW